MDEWLQTVRQMEYIPFILHLVTKIQFDDSFLLYVIAGLKRGGIFNPNRWPLLDIMNIMWRNILIIWNL